MTTLLRFRNREFQITTEIEKISSHQRSFDVLASILVNHLLFSADQTLDLEGHTVLDFGTGNFLSTCAAIKLLGAKAVDSFDIDNLVNLNATEMSLSQNAMYLRAVEHQLSDNVNANFRRFNRLSNADKLKFAVESVNTIVDANGIESAQNKLSKTYDLIYSYNVFEHIPLSDSKKIFNFLKTKLAHNAKMIIYIDYSNHKDPVHNPFDHIGDPNLNAHENGLGFSHYEFIETIKGCGLRIVRENASQDLELFEEERMPKNNFNGEVSALLVIQNG